MLPGGSTSIRVVGFSSMEWGDPAAFSLYNENGNKRRIFENFLEVKSGDFLICYESPAGPPDCCHW